MIEITYTELMGLVVGFIVGGFVVAPMVRQWLNW
jgi:hypothetical protein